MSPTIEKKPFGRTGHTSTRTIFGAFALSQGTREDADRTLDILLEYDINHIDTAASYGEAERLIGPWMAHHRDDFFLATKSVERTYQAARDELHRSLELLQTDHVDLWQLHCLVDPGEWEVAMGPGGMLEAAVEAREQGLTRFIGVTGHGMEVAAMHRRSLERFNFDAVLLPYNYAMMQDRAYAADFEALLETCRQRNVAVQTIKSLARRPWGDRPQTRFLGYEPFEDQADIETAVGWVLRNPQVFLNTTGQVDLLPRLLDAAARFQTGPTDEEMAQTARRQEMARIWEWEPAAP